MWMHNKPGGVHKQLRKGKREERHKNNRLNKVRNKKKLI